MEKNKKLKILHVVRQFYPLLGGIQNFVLNLSLQQIKQGHEVSVLTLNKSFVDKSTLSPQENYKNISIIRIPYIGHKKYPLAFSCTRYLSGFDIVHVHAVDFFIDYLVLTKFMHKKELILHTHGGFFHTKWAHNFKKFYFNTITRSTARGCKKIIASSDHDYRMFKKINNNIQTVENGVDIVKFKEIKKQVTKNKLLFIGRLSSNKNVEALIETIKELQVSGIDAGLTIIGPDWQGLRYGLENKAKKLNIQDKIKFLGAIDEETLMNELASTHLFVSASKYEGFGISAVEALASGTPCVLNDIESFRKIAENSPACLITDYNNPKKAAESIREVLGKSPKEYAILSQKASSLVQKYSWHETAKKITGIYYEVAGIREKVHEHVFE